MGLLEHLQDISRAVGAVAGEVATAIAKRTVTKRQMLDWAKRLRGVAKSIEEIAK